MNRKMIPLLILSFFLLSFTKEEGKQFTIFMIGDSTMANKSLKGGNPERGWGHMLPGFFSEEVQIDNHAVNGRSTKSFIEEGRWDKVISRVKPGDYVFIQFGHNDQKPDSARHTEPGSTFDANLQRFVEEVWANDAIAVLFTPIVRRHFDENGKLEDTHGAYNEAVKKVASAIAVPLIDLNKLTHDWIQNMGDEESRNYFVWIKEQTLPCCPEGKEDNTHLNIQGAKAVASLVVNELVKTVTDLTPFIRKYDFVVAQDGSGDFFTIQEAVNTVPDYRKEARTRILIRKGTYYEKLVIPESKINISLIGEEGTVISYDDYASKRNIFGENKSTSGSATCYFYGDNLYVENITFQNTSGPVGQAVAVLVSGDRTVFKRCRFLGFQDTLYTYGMNSRQYYEDCYIEGTVDFIFGWSTVVFNHCVIHSKGNGYITAPATPEGNNYGYVFFNCNITTDDNVNKVYLSRPWRPFAQAVFIRCNLGKHIVPEGWDNWGKKDAEETIFYAEYQNQGPGADLSERVNYSHQLKDLQGFTIKEIMAGSDNWNPQTDPETIISTTR